MKITEKTKDSFMFCSINRGDVFYCDGAYYIKTDDCTVNAVCLENGISCYFDDDRYVRRVDCELVVK